MKIWELRLKVYCKKDIDHISANETIQKLIDSTLSCNENFKKFHNENKFKLYCFDNLYPIQSDKIYKKDSIYQLRIRSVDTKLIQYLKLNIERCLDYDIRVVSCQLSIIPQRQIDKLYCITPTVIKTDKGYWRGNIGNKKYTELLKINAIKKLIQFTKSEIISDEVELFSGIKFKSKGISIRVKDITLVGDKIELNISNDEISQQLANLIIGAGLGEMNARGCGFVGYKWSEVVK